MRFEKGMMWLGTALAAIVGMYITNSAWCLWVFACPCLITISEKNIKKDNEEDE